MLPAAPLALSSGSRPMITVDPNTGELRGTKPLNPVRISIGFGVGLLCFTAIAGFASSFAPSPRQVEASVRDAIPFRNVNGAMYVYAYLGGVPHNMILDTGASSSQITVPIANALLARRRAHIVPGIFTTTIANGTAVPSQRVIVHTMSIGRHVLHNVEMIVADDGGAVLLGLSGTQRDRRFHHRCFPRPDKV
jgi:hypothetical protein